MPAKPRSFIIWPMILAILLVSLNLRPAITSVGPLLEIIREDLGLSNGQASLLTSVPVFCMGIFAPLAVPASRLFGLKRSVTLLLILIGVSTGMRGFLPGYPVLLVTSLAAGIAIAIIGPLLSAKIKQDFPARTGSLIGIYSFGMGAGATLSVGLTGVMFEWLSWPAALAVWSILALSGIIIWEWAGKQDAAPLPKEDAGRPAQSPWRNVRAWYMLFFFGFQASLFFAVTTWLAPLAINKGMTVVEGGAVLTLMSGVQIIINISIPAILNWFSSRLTLILAVLATGSLGLLLIVFGPEVGMWPAAVCLGISLGALFPIALLMPLDETASAKDANSWTAMIQSGGFIMAGAAPLVVGLLIDWSGSYGWTVPVLFLLIAGMAVFALLLSRGNEESGAVSGV